MSNTSLSPGQVATGVTQHDANKRKNEAAEKAAENAAAEEKVKNELGGTHDFSIKDAISCPGCGRAIYII